MDCLQWICCLNYESAHERNALLKKKQATPAASSINDDHPSDMQDPSKCQQPVLSEGERLAMITQVYKNLVAQPNGSFNHFPKLSEEDQERA